jgi:two-component system chemotaxis response regulator CheY
MAEMSKAYTTPNNIPCIAERAAAPRIPQALHFSEETDMGKTILIVDDSTSLRQVVGIALKGAGYEVIEGCDGKDALTKLDGRKIHLIISDVNMPNMDGISFVKALKQIPAYKFTPVIMLTTEAGDDKKRKARPPAPRPGWSSPSSRRRC